MMKARGYVQNGDNQLSKASIEAALKSTTGVPGSDVLQAAAVLRRLKAPKLDEQRWRQGASFHEVGTIPPQFSEA